MVCLQICATHWHTSVGDLHWRTHYGEDTTESAITAHYPAGYDALFQLITTVVI
jgi:hypothetical protein